MSRVSDRGWLNESAKPAPTNDSTVELNRGIQNRLADRQSRTCLSRDSVVDVDEVVEPLNCQLPSGSTLHELALKVGSPIILLRSLKAPKMCNGTRVVVKHLRDNLIVAAISTGIQDQYPLRASL